MTPFFLPSYFRRTGTILLAIGLLGFIPYNYLANNPSFRVDWMPMVLITCVTLAFPILLFSKLRNEDELISSIRMKVLVFAMQIMSLLLVVGSLFMLYAPGEYGKAISWISLFVPISIYSFYLRRVLEQSGFTQNEIEKMLS